MASKLFQNISKVFKMVLRADSHLPAKRYTLQEVETYEVERIDFERIRSESRSVGTHLQLFFFWLPIAIMLTVTLSTIAIPNVRLRELYGCLMFVGYGFSLFHGAFAFRQRGSFDRLMNSILERQIPPLGEKGSELGPSEVDELPAGSTAPIGPGESAPRGSQ